MERGHLPSSSLRDRGLDPRAPGKPRLSVCHPRHEGWFVQIAGICITEQWRDMLFCEAVRGRLWAGAISAL